MLVVVVEISRPSFIGGFDFLSAQLCDDQSRSLQLRFVRSVVQSDRVASPGPASTAE
jgi:hypothetical protein